MGDPVSPTIAGQLRERLRAFVAPPRTRDDHDSPEERPAAVEQSSGWGKMLSKAAGLWHTRGRKNGQSSDSEPTSPTAGNSTTSLPEMFHCPTSPPQPSADPPAVECSQLRTLRAMLASDDIDIGESRDTGLRRLCWNGIPWEVRAECWKLLTGYLSPSHDRREADLQRKRKEYREYVRQYYDTEHEAHWMLSATKIIRKDVPRTAPEVPLFQTPVMQRLLEHILVIWAFRHPASGYVQGMNDLMLPFFYVFLARHVDRRLLLSSNTGDIEEALREMGSALEEEVEPDTYWCFNRLLEHIQDHYTDNQPGIQSKLQKLDGLLKRMNAKLHAHLEEHQVQLFQFAFKWVNCLLVREFPLDRIVRVWDTYLSEGDGFGDLHVYVCITLLMKYSDDLLRMDFGDMIRFLQAPPVASLSDRDLGEVIAKAYQLQQLYDTVHLQ